MNQRSFVSPEIHDMPICTAEPYRSGAFRRAVVRTLGHSAFLQPQYSIAVVSSPIHIFVLERRDPLRTNLPIHRTYPIATLTGAPFRCSRLQHPRSSSAPHDKNITLSAAISLQLRSRYFHSVFLRLAVGLVDAKVVGTSDFTQTCPHQAGEGWDGWIIH
jgi:hypothetical protein